VTGHRRLTSALLAFLALVTPVSVLAAPSEGAAAAPSAAPEASATATTGKTPNHHFELGAFLGASWTPRPLAVEAGVVSDRVFGVVGSVSLAYRGPFFMYPFIEVGYYDISSTTLHPVSSLGTISSAKVENHLGTWTFQIGPGVDVGPMRFRLAWGVYDHIQSSKGPDFNDKLSSIGFTTSLVVSCAVLRTPGFRLNVEAKGSTLTYTGSALFALGVSGAGDFLSW
jgi:hypothetical protein